MKKCAVLYNPKSGKQQFSNYIDYVTKKLENKGYEVQVFATKSKEDVIEKAKILSQSIELLIVSGGDGTLNDVINGLMMGNPNIKLGYIPAGTTCDVAHTFYIPKNIEKALDIILNEKVKCIDLMKVNDRYSIYVCGAGAYIDVSYSTSSKLKKYLGHLAYIASGVYDFFTIPKMNMTIKCDDFEIKDKFSMVLFINSKRVAGIRMIKCPKLNDGLIDVVLYKFKPLLNNLIFGLSFLFPNLKLKLVKRIKAHKIEVTSDYKKPWTVDGEIGDIGNLKLKVVKQKVNFIVPDKVVNKYF